MNLMKQYCSHWLKTFTIALATMLCTSLPRDSAASEGAAIESSKAIEDIEMLCKFVSEEYAYFDIKQVDWNHACNHYRGLVAGPISRTTLISLFEGLLGELYDHHAHLGTHTPTSPRLVPTSSQLYASIVSDKVLITDILMASEAWRSGLRAGTEILSIDGKPTAEAVRAIAPKFLKASDPAALTWALQTALAGRHDQKVHRLQVREAGAVRELHFGNSTQHRPRQLISYEQVEDIAYVRINNSLGDSGLVSQFDEALDSMPAARALLLDLRDTPSGGTSQVARGILGRLVSETTPYQRHELVSEFRESGIARVWTEHVVPRGTPFTGPVVVLVGRWTASMGEGIAIGLNAACQAPVVGSPMAHLVGALGETVLPNSRVVVRVPVEKLFHIDGSHREAFRPTPITTSNDPVSDDELHFAMSLAKRQITK